MLREGKDVHVANRAHFIHIIKQWERDPCERLTRTKEGTWVVNGTVPDAEVERVEDSTNGQMRWAVISGTVLPARSGDIPRNKGCFFSSSGQGKTGMLWSC